jgi:hypothetical protein
MTTKRKSAPAEPPPMVAGCEDYERADWLPVIPELDWLQALREQHVAAVTEFGLAVLRIGEIEDDGEEARRAWRRDTRDAVAAGEAPPERPFDPEVHQAERELAEEDLTVARDRVSMIVVAALQECRARRDELEPFAADLGAPLRRAVRSGLEASIDDACRDLKERLARLRDEPPIVDVSDPANAALTQSESAEVSHAAA